MNAKEIGGKFLCSSHIKYYGIIFVVSLLLFSGDLFRLRKSCKFDPLLSRGHIVKTPGCSIPNYLYCNVNDIPYIFNALPLPKCCNHLPKFVDSDSKSIYINKEVFHNTSWDINKLYCEFRPCSKRDILKNCPSTYALQCKEEIHDVYVLVNCSYDNIQSFYHDFFTFAPKVEIPKEVQRSDVLNVIVWVLQGVSRLNFHRQLRKTAKVMQRLRAVEFYGYNKVEENAYRNMVPIFNGFDSTEALLSCKHDKNCPLIFNEFKKRGYATSFAEDALTGSMFNFPDGNGSEKLPIDYFWSPYHMQLTTQKCIGRKSILDSFFEYSEKLLEAIEIKRRHFFGVFWSELMTHTDINFHPHDDGKLAKFILSLYTKRILNDTVLILLSDDDVTYGQMRLTPLGSVEDRLPLLYVYLPTWYRNKFSPLFLNLAENSRRLVTPFDIHKTLLDLTDPFEIKDRIMDNPAVQREFSLFSLISPNRTCDDARISLHKCACKTFRDISPSDSVSIKVARYANHFMEISSESTDTNAKFNGQNEMKVLTNRLHVPIPESGMDSDYQDYTVLFRVDNCSNNFEATIRKMGIRNIESSYMIFGNATKLNSCEKCRWNGVWWFPPIKMEE